MSVKAFDPLEIQKIRDSVIDTLVQCSDFKYYVIKSNLFKQRFYFNSKSKLSDVNELNIINSLINKLFWYLHIANQVAYALQYSTQPQFDFEGFVPQENKCLYLTKPKKALRDEIVSLQYNILTNDGNYFLSKDWEQLLENILAYFDRE